MLSNGAEAGRRHGDCPRRRRTHRPHGHDDLDAPDYAARLHRGPSILADAERHAADLRAIRDEALAGAAAGLPAGVPLAESLQRDFIGPLEAALALARALGVRT